MHLMSMKLSFSFPQGITSSASWPEMVDKFFFRNFLMEKGIDLLLQDTAFENGHTYESINLIE